MGRQVEGLVHCEKECLGGMELYLGTADEPMESVRTKEQSSAVDVVVGVCYQIT